MPFPLLLPLALGAVGAARGLMQNKRAQEIENQDRRLAAETARYSPWTGMTPQAIRPAGSAFGDVLGGATTGFAGGAMLGQGLGMGADAPTGGTGNAAIDQSPSIWEQLRKPKPTLYGASRYFDNPTG